MNKILQNRIEELTAGIREIIGRDQFILKYKPDRHFDNQKKAIEYYEKAYNDEVSKIKGKFN